MLFKVSVGRALCHTHKGSQFICTAHDMSEMLYGNIDHDSFTKYMQIAKIEFPFYLQKLARTSFAEARLYKSTFNFELKSSIHRPLGECISRTTQRGADLPRGIQVHGLEHFWIDQRQQDHLLQLLHHTLKATHCLPGLLVRLVLPTCSSSSLACRQSPVWGAEQCLRAMKAYECHQLRTLGWNSPGAPFPQLVARSRPAFLDTRKASVIE